MPRRSARTPRTAWCWPKKRRRRRAAAEGRERVALEHDNFRAGLDWLTETGDADWGLRLGTALFRFWESREFLAEGRDRLGKVLRMPSAGAPTKARARAGFGAGGVPHRAR